MVKKIIIFLFILPIFLLGISTTIFVYSEETQSFIIQSFNLKSIFDKKIKKIISRKMHLTKFIIPKDW